MCVDAANKQKKVSDKITDRLETMTKLAKNLPRPAEIRELARDFKHIRLGGNGFMGVSLHWLSPLKGHSSAPAKSIETISSHFGKAVPIPDTDFPEQRLQGWLIREAMMNDRNLKIPLQLNSEFDELVFALDEVSIGGRGVSVNDLQLPVALLDAKDAVRCDLLAVGRKGSDVFPVVIELKVDRKEKRLHDQLNNFAKLMVLFNRHFIDLLNEVVKDTDLKLSEISYEKVRKIMVWPVSESGKFKTDPLLHNANGIDVIVFHPEKLRKEYPPVDRFTSYVV
jgi:hypothetical protein